MNLQEQIINTTIDLFNEKGYRFRLDDIAKKLFISKKTIYTQFRDKEALFMEMIRYCGRRAASAQRKILDNGRESYTEKVRRLLAVWPEQYRRLDQSKLIELRRENPKIAEKVKEYYDEEWELIEDTLKEAMLRGEIIHISTSLIRIMLESALERRGAEEVLRDSNLRNDNIRKDVVRILMNGIEIL